jgi:PKD repeat protein
LTPINVTLAATAGTATAAGQPFTFTAAVTGGGEGTANAPIESYSWDFGDGTSATTSGNSTAHVYETSGTPQRYTVTVTVRTPDGRSSTGRTEIIVASFP